MVVYACGQGWDNYQHKSHKDYLVLDAKRVILLVLWILWAVFTVVYIPVLSSSFFFFFSISLSLPASKGSKFVCV